MMFPVRRYPVSHVRFSIVFCVSLFVLCNLLTLGRLSQWFREGEALDLSALSAFLAAGLCLFIAVFVLFAHRFLIKTFAILLTLLSGAAVYFISKYGVAIDSSMILNVMHTDAVEVGQLLSWQMLPYVIFLMIVPTLLIAVVDVRFRPQGRYLWESLKVFGIALVAALSLLAFEYRAIYRAGNASSKYIVYSLVPINVISGSINAATKTLRPYFATDQRSLKVSAAVATPGDLVVVLAVGESSRRANFSLYGYGRDTNPILETIDGLHHLDGIATRASTLYALPKILEKQGIKLTTLTAKAGVPTVCYVNYSLYDNCAAVGEIKASRCGHGGKCYDEDVVPLLREDLRHYQAGYRFIVLHLGGGSHGPLYGDRHPPEFRRFQPTCDDADVANRCSVEQLYNSYDNTILYLDHVIGDTLGVLEASKVPYVFIYVSDHGESLMEEGRLFHGVPPGMSLPAEQADIPLLVKASIPLTVQRRPQYVQPDIFDSILDLFSIESPGFDKAGSFLVSCVGKARSPTAAQAYCTPGG